MTAEMEGKLAISRLALAMSTAGTDGDTFTLAADACSKLFAGICCISVALVTKQGNLNCFKLSPTSSSSHSHMGNLPVVGTAAGFAVHTQQAVGASRFSSGSAPAFGDWAHLHTEEGAHSLLTLPLLVADTATGSITLASTEGHAFDGQETLASMLAAVLAPYLGLQKVRKELKAIEGVLHQMVPMKVALKLANLQSQALAQATALGMDGASGSSQPGTQ